jgi:tetratricopeptide (TPR) repeat protein
MRTYSKICLLLILTGCLYKIPKAELTQDLQQAIERVGKELEAESIKLHPIIDDNKLVSKSLEISFKNCSGVAIDDTNWVQIMELIFNRVIAYTNSDDSLPKIIRLRLDQGLGIGVLSNRKLYSRDFSEHYITNSYLQYHDDLYLFDKQIRAYIDHRNYNKAIALSDSFININADHNYGYQYRAIAHYESGDTAKAVEDFKTATKMDSLDTESYLNLALLKHQQNEKPKALAYIDTALLIDPRNPKAVFYRGMFNYQNGDTGLGCADILRSKELGYTNGSMSLVFDCH